MKYFTLSVLVCISVTAFSQNTTFDDLIQRRVVECRDVQLNAFRIVKDLYTQHQTDSLYRFIDYWENKCGVTALSHRLRLVLDIRTGSFTSDRISSQEFDDMVYYKEWKAREGMMDPETIAMGYAETIENVIRLDHYIQSIILDTPPPANIDAQLFLDFYSTNNPTFERIRQASPEESKLKRFHDIEYNRAVKSIEGHVAVFTGFVQPIGKLSAFGTRPNLGLILGTKMLRHGLDLTLDIRFGPSSSEYIFQYQDSLYRTKEYSGLYIALEYNYDILLRKNFVVSLTSGVGYEQISVLPDENEYGEKSKVIPTINFSGGLMTKFFLKRERFIGIQTRYNVVNFSNPGGTDLAGDYFSLRLVFGGITSPLRSQRLRELE